MAICGLYSPNWVNGLVINSLYSSKKSFGQGTLISPSLGTLSSRAKIWEYGNQSKKRDPDTQTDNSTWQQALVDANGDHTQEHDNGFMSVVVGLPANLAQSRITSMESFSEGYLDQTGLWVNLWGIILIALRWDNQPTMGDTVPLTGDPELWSWAHSYTLPPLPNCSSPVHTCMHSDPRGTDRPAPLWEAAFLLEHSGGSCFASCPAPSNPSLASCICNTDYYIRTLFSPKW